MKISAVLIVKNEEAVLRDCLESITGADEIIICDTGSTDRTVEIAQEYGTVYTDYKWQHSFADARNHAKKKATGDWILSIDADERLETGMDRIRDAISRCGGNAIDVVMYSGNQEFYFPRLFKNSPDIQWKGAAHNYLTGAKNIATSDIRIYFGYSPTHAKEPDRTFKILKKVAKEGCREKFYLAREYMYKKDWKQAITWLNRYLKIAHWVPEWAEAHLMKAQCLWNLSRGDEARDECLQALKLNTHFKEAILYLAKMSGPINRKRWEEFAQGADNSNVLFARTKAEKGADYYNALFASQNDFSRYDAIHKQIGTWVGDRKVLDIGCGRGDVAKYIKNYSGFDFSAEGIKHAPNSWMGDLYDKANYKDADIYLALEVLEHVDDTRLIQNIPPGKDFIFSVPSFPDPSHIRTYDEMTIRKLDVDISEIVRFNWNGKWQPGGSKTDSFILLARATR